MMSNTTSILDDASPHKDVPAMTETTESVSSNVGVEEEDEKDPLEGVRALIQDLFHSDNAKVNTTLDALGLDLGEDKKKCEKIHAVGGCIVLVHLLKKCIEKAIDRSPACDQVTKLNELAELKTLHKTLHVINNVAFHHDGSKVGIIAIGGVEAVVQVMKTFPKCKTLQCRACTSLINLTRNSAAGNAKAIESGAFEVLLAAVNNHLNSAEVCEHACKALYNIVLGSEENTGLLISFGGGAAVVKVRTKWPDNDKVLKWVRNLAKLLAAESLEGVRALIQDLFHSDNAKAYAITLNALHLDLKKDKKKCDKIQAVGGCFVLVQLLKKCLDKAIDECPACDQVTELNELAELTPLYNTLCVIFRLTFQHDASKVGIIAVGGVEAAVKVMKTFPECQRLQACACAMLGNLASISIGKMKAIEWGAIEVVLTAVSKHLGSVIVCECAFRALVNVALDSKENTGLLIRLGGGAAVAKVRTNWSDHANVQTRVRKLAMLLVAEMNSWGDSLKKVTKNAPACDLVTKVNKLPELANTHKAWLVIRNLSYYSGMGRVGAMVAIGGVEAAVKVLLQSFPKCQQLQERACGALTNFRFWSIGKKRSMEAGGIEILLVAVTNNHLNSAFACKSAC